MPSARPGGSMPQCRMPGSSRGCGGRGGGGVDAGVEGGGGSGVPLVAGEDGGLGDLSSEDDDLLVVVSSSGLSGAHMLIGEAEIFLGGSPRSLQDLFLLR
ncbi:hypothetical protein J437_LFUL014671 [Ladona fulva]|uniref:Uncharacterized protein n=1 Tax=Ladona fulva TaxID=123851 RepID=A0A8K0KBY2_LADFU|nr:hypothetical protein J437_LFUL014671 [Ladona fulva]